MSSRAAFALAAVLAACGAPPREPSVVIPPPPSTAAQGIVAGADDVAVRVDLRGPAHVRWTPARLRAEPANVRVAVENHGSTVLDVTGLRVRLAATREGVPFSCPEEGARPEDVREPGILPPGAMAVFERVVDCALPLAGTYAIRIEVAFGHEGGAWFAWRTVREMTIAVSAPAKAQPRAVEAVPGLWAAMGTGRVIPSSVRGGSGTLAVALTNGGVEPLALPPLRVAFRVYRDSASIPCEDEPVLFEAPPILEPGRTYMRTLAVSCLGLGAPGHYVIAARLLVPGSTTDAEIGRIRVEVSSDPSRSFPTR